MSDNYSTIKVKKETLELIEEATEVFLKHHKHLEGVNITKNLIIHRALKYYIEN